MKTSMKWPLGTLLVPSIGGALTASLVKCQASVLGLVREGDPT